MTKIVYNSYIIEEEEKIMTDNYNDRILENEDLVSYMLQKKNDSEFDCNYRLGYLESFVANAMEEIPEMKERVKDRILLQIKLEALSSKAA